MSNNSPSPEFLDASSGDFNQPPAKRPRLMSKACETCKQKKSKCDSSRPKCENCRRKGAACIYKEKGLPGLRPGYGKALESRLGVLEDSVEKMNNSIQQLLNQVQAQTQNVVQHQSHAQYNAQGTVPLATSEESEPTQTSEHPQIWQNGQEYVPQQQSLDAMPYTSPLDPEPLPLIQRMQHVPQSSWQFNIDSGLPPEEVLRELIDLFFELMYPWLPLFCKPHFMSNIFDPQREILLHGIILVTFRYSLMRGISTELRERYVKVCRDKILLTTMDTCTLVSTQALALLAVDAIGQGPGPRTWNVMSMLVAASRHLGLNKSPETVVEDPNHPMIRNEDEEEGLNLTNVGAEEKRRLFWVICSLDRLSSVSHGQPGGINSNTIKTLYPGSDEEWGQPGSADWFEALSPQYMTATHAPANLWHYYIDVLALVDKSHQLLIQPVNPQILTQARDWQGSFRRLDFALSAWFENLPKEVRDLPAEFDPMWYTLHATFILISLRMYTTAAFPSTTSQHFRPSSCARGRCRQAVRNMAALANSVQPHELRRLGPMFAFVVWVAARSMVILWTCGHENTYGSVPPDLESLLNILRQMAVWWHCTERYVELIQLIVNTRNDPGGPTGLRIFNDVRKTVYGLQKLLGTLAGHRATDKNPRSFDFLDIPILDGNEMGTSQILGFGPEVDDEWL